ncbi:hypothetical protein V1291_004852 [Nitrobacteraceae bacterium AZCC 1564]
MKIPAVFLSLSLALIFLTGPSLAGTYEQCERIASKRYQGTDATAYRAKERFIKSCMMAQKK